jgi:hypothetical protein
VKPINEALSVDEAVSIYRQMQAEYQGKKDRYKQILKDIKTLEDERLELGLEIRGMRDEDILRKIGEIAIRG